jgi:hypothetical protein
MISFFSSFVFSSVLLPFVAVTVTVSLAQAQEYSGPEVSVPPVELSDYCVSQENGVLIPKRENDLVRRAEEKLMLVYPTSFYFYSGPLKAYGLSKPGAGLAKIEAQKINANIFLTVLCNEFRDRPTMIKEKLIWVTKIYKLFRTPNNKPIDPSQDLWSQVGAALYNPYLEFSKALWYARQSALLESGGTLKLGKYEVDKPVDGQLVCETKAIFSEFIKKKKAFKDLAEYNSVYSKYKVGKTGAHKNCQPDELETYYDFRGDSNFKPNSPESNAMIWHANSVSNQCVDTLTAKNGAKISSKDCQSYFLKPFASRWNAARAGLASWLFHKREFDEQFSDTRSRVRVIPHREGGLRPFLYQLEGSETPIDGWLDNWVPFEKLWPLSGLGFNEVSQIENKNKSDLGFFYERLRDAVNRHTDWYASGYKDWADVVKDQAYSPFVASSYEMSASNAFTQPGVTVQSASDGRKQWMFVFRVRKENWYNTAKIKALEPVNFDKNWFDETSLGTVGLAKSERAWDRLGTALEGEMDSILYLHNLDTSGEVMAKEVDEQ